MKIKNPKIYAFDKMSPGDWDSFIAKGEIDVKDINGNDPLSFACEERDLELAQRLIKAGSDVNSINQFKQPSLYQSNQKVNSGDENNSNQNSNNNLNELTKTPASLSISKGLGHGKAVLDSGLGMLKAFLFYKGNDAGRRVVEVCEKYSTTIYITL